jgi:hypothetical protein
MASPDVPRGALNADVPVDAISKEVAAAEDGGEGDGIGLVLGGHSLDEDENGLFISGTVINMSDHAFDAVRIAFDLRDSQNQPYSYVADTATETM